MRRAAFALALLATPAAADDLPAGFVRLRDVAPTIRQDMRYAGSFNFTGARVPGYEAGACILLKATAEGLAKAQAALEPQGLSLVVWDCYRPRRAVAAFAAWSKAPGEGSAAIWHPGLEKKRLFALGYIASKSTHSKGVAVDLGIVRQGDSVATPGSGGRCDGPKGARAAETSLDFGTAYDCFSTLSATSAAGISAEAQANRRLLVSVMTAAGFRNYAKEWWHFQLSPEPAGARAEDFVVR